MSIKIGSVEPCPGLASASNPESVVRFDPRAPKAVHVFASADGVELVSLPCVLSVTQACDLVCMLRSAIEYAAGFQSSDTAKLDALAAKLDAERLPEQIPDWELGGRS